eukprot:9440743-Pyramimonas_sp.AAC.1
MSSKNQARIRGRGFATGPVSNVRPRISAAERVGTGRMLGRAPPPMHGFGDRAPSPWIANPCLRAP